MQVSLDLTEVLGLIIGAGGLGALVRLVVVLTSLKVDVRHLLTHIEDHEERLRGLEGGHHV